MSSSATAGGGTDRVAPGVLPWSGPVRLLVSALLLWHVTALVVGPMSVPPTITGDFFRRIYRPYLAATYLDHGYKFFAPDPGPSHLVKYELELADGTRREGVFPNLDDQWPRLFYHRHFMLSEFVNLAPPDPNWTPRSDWTKQPLAEGQKRYASAYANHLLKKHQAKRARLWLVEHLIPAPEEVARGVPLDHPDSYRQRELGSFAGAP